jgi:hypothetical protein
VGRTEELILKLYEAFRRQDIDELVGGMHPKAEFKPVPSSRAYLGPEDIRLFFEKDIYELAEFDFRVVSVLEYGDKALLFGRHRIWEDDELKDKSIFWASEVEDGMLAKFEPFERITDAVSAFGQRGAEL